MLADTTQKCPDYFQKISKNNQILLTIIKHFLIIIVLQVRFFNKMIKFIFSFVALFLFLNNNVQASPTSNKCSCNDGLKENFSLIDLTSSQ